MLRFAGLILILGLALGLWIGFNPKAHQDAVQSWDREKASFQALQVEASVKFHEWSSPNVSGGASPSIEIPQPLLTFWRDFTSTLANIWDAIVNVWMKIIRGLSLPNI